MPLPVLTVEQMRLWENATWQAGRSPESVIARAGEMIARRALTLTHPGQSIVLLAGPGHNGDDARATQTHLADRKVTVLNISDPEKSLDPLAAALTKNPALIIDGLFGIGLNRPLTAAWQKIIEAVNTAGIPILSIDVPSGLNADSGQVAGAALRATVTLTLGAPKQGLLNASAWPYVGRLEVAHDIGLVPHDFENVDTHWTCADDFLDFPPARPVATHKGSFGHLCLLAGSTGYHGAAVIASRGALRAQPGLVSLFIPAPAFPAAAAQLHQAMVHPWQTGRSLPGSTTALVAGPGLAAADLSGEIRSHWETFSGPMIVDASALPWLPASSTVNPFVRIITPHPGEAARLLGMMGEEIQRDRPAALRALSQKFGRCHVVLKGHQTLVGTANGPIFVNSSGNPSLAQGGTGDLLAGFLGGLLAQPVLAKNPTQSICYAVWAHGAAADDLSERFRNWNIDNLEQTIGNHTLTQLP